MDNADKVETLIAWLEKQPAKAEYKYTNVCGCLMHRYYVSQGVPVSTTGGETLFLRVGNNRTMPASFACLAVTPPHTYGAALARARALLAHQ